MIHPYNQGVGSAGVSEWLLDGVTSIAAGGTQEVPHVAFFRADGKTVRIYLRIYQTGTWTMDIDDPDLTPENLGHVDWIGLRETL